MRPAHVIEIVTPKKFLLNGLWFGPSFAQASKGKPRKPKRAIIWVHGLSSSAFSKLGIVEKLADAETVVMTFNNRGHDTVNKLYQGKRLITAGGGAEVFTECVDDIEGAIRFAKRAGVKNIYLAGHSTGCQKAVYWAYTKGKGVKGIILLAPLSDWAGAVRTKAERSRVRKAAAAAEALIRARKPHAFLPDGLWVHPITAQRFRSLYTPDSIEQSIFSYFRPERASRYLQRVSLPLLVFLAAKDEYADRPARDIEEWLRKNTGSRDYRSVIIPRAGHSFKAKESEVAAIITQWISV